MGHGHSMVIHLITTFMLSSIMNSDHIMCSIIYDEKQERDKCLDIAFI